MQKLLSGYHKFRAEVFPKRAKLFQSLESGQTPSTLFLTCSDSRIVPDLILQSDPGELFISRNAGNIVPPFGEVNGGVTATIEYAVQALGVQNIVVCGHSDCGAMKAVLSGKRHEQMPTVDKWLRHSASAMQMVPPVDADGQSISSPKDRLRTLTRANVLTHCSICKHTLPSRLGPAAINCGCSVGCTRSTPAPLKATTPLRGAFFHSAGIPFGLPSHHPGWNCWPPNCLHPRVHKDDDHDSFSEVRT